MARGSRLTQARGGRLTVARDGRQTVQANSEIGGNRQMWLRVTGSQWLRVIHGGSIQLQNIV